MTSERRKRFRACVMLMLAMLLGCIILPFPAWAAETAENSSEMPLTIEIRNRLFGAFHEIHETTMNKREQVGDTDYFYEVVEFFPDFAIIDSTMKAVTLSEEAKNTAFKIMVYENDEILETTWAFYHLDVPHFQRTSFLTFKVIRFEYRDEVFSKEEKEGKEEKGEKKEKEEKENQ